MISRLRLPFSKGRCAAGDHVWSADRVEFARLDDVDPGTGDQAPAFRSRQCTRCGNVEYTGLEQRLAAYGRRNPVVEPDEHAEVSRAHARY